MDPNATDYWTRVHAHVDALLDRPIAEHDAYLDVHCPDARMRRDVTSWLAHIHAPPAALDASAADHARVLLDDTPPPRTPAGLQPPTAARLQSPAPQIAPENAPRPHRWPPWVALLAAGLVGALVLWWALRLL